MNIWLCRLTVSAYQTTFKYGQTILKFELGVSVHSYYNWLILFLLGPDRINFKTDRINFKYYFVHFKALLSWSESSTHMVSPSRYIRQVDKDTDIYLRTNWTLIHYGLNPFTAPWSSFCLTHPPDSPTRISTATQPLNGNPLPQVHLIWFNRI